jgi:hypothetical protein
MVKGDAAALLDSYRVALRDALARFDEASLLKLRGDLQVVALWLDGRKDAERAKSAAAALEAVSRFYSFGVEVGGFSASNKAADVASLYDLASVGVLGMENILTAERKSLMRFLMSGLSEGLMFLGSREYVRGSTAVLEATYKAHALTVRDALWALAMDFRGPGDLDSIQEARAAIDTLFSKFDDPSVPVPTKVALLYQLYGLVAVVRCAQLLEDLQELQ